MGTAELTNSDACVPDAPIAPPMSARLDPAPVIAGWLVFALVLFTPALLNDGDTLWQIRTGEWILDHRAIPTVDPFSFTAGARRWFPHEWLAEVLLAMAFRAAGLKGVMVLCAAAAGLTAAVVLRHLRRFLPGVYAVAGLVLVLCNLAPSLLARPHLLSWPCLALWCGGLVVARANRTPPSFWLLPVMALWVNLHGSFMLGLLLPGAFMIEAALDSREDRFATLARWGLFVAAAWAAAALNPAFIDGLLFPIRMVGMKSLAWIGEWGPTDFSRLQPLEIILLAALALGFSGKVRLPIIRGAMFLGLVHGALAHARDEQLLAIVGAMILAEPLGATLRKGDAPAFGDVWRLAAAGGAILAAVALAARLVVPLRPETELAAFSAMLERLAPGLRARPVLNEYGLGGRLIFNRVAPFIDSRADLYGDAFITRYQAIITPRRVDLERALSEYGVCWTLFRSGDPIVAMLDDEPRWTRIVQANGLVIHVWKNCLTSDAGVRPVHAGVRS
jgi:hypothetical protein